MNFKNLSKFKFALAGLTLIMSSCVSTDTVEDPLVQKSSDEITLTLSRPAETKTRADDSHKLRYTAKLFTITTGTSFDPSTMQRKEIIEDETSADNQITFSVEPDKKYIIFVFADYIPAASRPSDGKYNDYYYNTQTANSSITMITNPGGGTEKITSEFFNNNHYDCFSCVDTVHKTTLKKEHTIILDRAVAQIRFIDTGDNAEKFASLQPETINILSSFSQQNQSGGASTSFSKTDLQKILFSEMTSPQNNELFFFYSFGWEKQTSMSNLSQIAFTVTNTSEISKPTTISAGKLPVVKNYITTAKGLFISADTGSGNDDDNNKGDESGDIILNVSTNNNWENPETGVEIM